MEPGDDWLQTVLLQIAILQPHTKRVLKIDDFYPYRKRAAQTPQEQLAVLQRATAELTQHYVHVNNR